MPDFIPCKGCDEPEACEIEGRCLEPAAVEYVGWQFRYVFEDQGNRRSDWSTVSTGEPSFTSGYRSYNGWQRRFYLEVRRVYAGVVEPYIEDQHHKPGTAGVTVGTIGHTVPPGGIGLATAALGVNPSSQDQQQGGA